MARLSHVLEYIPVLAGVKLAQALPGGMADRIASGLGGLVGLLWASRRRIAMENLERALGASLSVAERKAITAQVFRQTAKTLFDFARMGKIAPLAPRHYFVSDGLDQLERIHSQGKGGVIVSAHFGSFEMWGLWLALTGLPMTFLTGVQHNPLVDRILSGFRHELGVQIIPKNQALRGVLRALKEGRFVALLADQHDANGVVIDFFGRPAGTPKGPAFFAIKSGAPIIPYMMRRESHDRHILMAGQAIYPPGSGDIEADARIMTTAYSSFFEECIRRYPQQWLWTHRRWKLD
ncbi:MAG: lysophospholipid acyltransferase family protein [bacterium]